MEVRHQTGSPGAAAVVGLPVAASSDLDRIGGEARLVDVDDAEPAG